VFLYGVGTVELINSKFEECKTGSWGGGTYIERFSSPKSEDGTVKNCISGCYFTKCNGWSGGGILISSPPADFKMQNTIFISCHANSFGGGIFFQPNSKTINNSKLFYYCYFENNSSPKGNDLFFDEYYYETHIETPFVYSFSSSPEDRVWKRNISAQKYYNVTWLESGTLNRYISNVTGIDPDKRHECDCMNLEEPCKTMEYALDLKIEGVHSAVVIKDEFKVNMNDKQFTLNENDKLTLRGFDNTTRKPVITVSNIFAKASGLFNCSSFTFNVKTSIDTLFKIKKSETSGGRVFLKNIALNCKILLNLCFFKFIIFYVNLRF